MSRITVTLAGDVAVLTVSAGSASLPPIELSPDALAQLHVLLDEGGVLEVPRRVNCQRCGEETWRTGRERLCPACKSSAGTGPFVPRVGWRGLVSVDGGAPEPARITHVGFRIRLHRQSGHVLTLKAERRPDGKFDLAYKPGTALLASLAGDPV